MANFREVASEFSDAFETNKRDDGKQFVTRKDNCADWITTDVIREIHEALDDRLPSDWVYEIIAAAADYCSEYESADDCRDRSFEFSDGQVDVYNADRLHWLADHLNNAFLCDEAEEELGPSEDTFSRIGYGQYLGIERIYHAVVDQIESEVEQRESVDV